jgi:formylglycine-generating enzyme required for sulfatase activity
MPAPRADSSSVPGYKNTFDLSGNLAEWEDACDADHNAGRPNDACRVRGGSFDDDVQAKLACNADRVVPRNSTLDDVGFRCCGP